MILCFVCHYVESFTVATMTWLTELWNICVTNDHGYAPPVVDTSLSFTHSWLVTGFVTRLAQRVAVVEQVLLAHPEHLSSPPVFSGIRVAWSFVFCVMFCRSLFVLFHLVVALSLLWFTASDYSFGIFNLFLSSSGVPHVASVSGLSILDRSFGFL